MPNISEELFNKKKSTLEAMRADRRPWWEHWREVADYFLPRRYVWLLSRDEQRQVKSKNPFILDATGTMAARTLASGMMNGITSPSRPWFRLRIPGMTDDQNRAVRLWLDEVERRLMTIMGQTNFYNAMGVLYLDLGVFGTAGMLIYEDFKNVFRCYNSALGEYYIAQDDRLLVNTFAREFIMKVHQVVGRFGDEYLSARVKDAWKAGGGRLQEDVEIVHLIEPNDPRDGLVPDRFAFRELYWENNSNEGKLLAVAPYNELPGVFPRWDIVGNDAYGSSPAMDALPDVIQLQHETKKKAQGLDKMVSPPVVADIQLQNKPTALLPNGITYVSSASQVGVKPIYTVAPPIAEMTQDILDIRGRIQEMFHNDLFRMIADLDTVRSATEIDARREEKLVLLGPVLERFEVEALDPALLRIFNIANRAGLLPEPPEEVQGAEIEVQYVSILSAAQKAVAAIPTERWLQLIAQIGPIAPSVLNVPDFDEIVRDYGRDIGVKEKYMRDKKDSDSDTAAQREQANLQQQVETGKVAAEGAAALAGTVAGQGSQALQQVLG